jgi:hypothetical protein
MPGGEAAERLHEDLARAFRVGAKESADRHLELDLVSQDRFFGEVT